MKTDHVFTTTIGDEMVGYGNLKLLLQTIGSHQKYYSVRRTIAKNGEALVDGVLIKKLPVIRGTKNG